MTGVNANLVCEGWINYPTYYAHQWLKRSSEAADNWMSIFKVFDKQEFDPPFLRSLMEEALQFLLEEDEKKLSRVLMRWAVDMVCWEFLYLDIFRTLTAGQDQHEFEREVSRYVPTPDRRSHEWFIRYQVIFPNRGFCNFPTAAVMNWISEQGHDKDLLNDWVTPETRMSTISTLLDRELGPTQARSGLATQMLNWVLKLISYDELEARLMEIKKLREHREK